MNNLILAALALIFTGQSALAEITTGTFSGKTNDGEKCSLTILSVSGPRKVEYGPREGGIQLVYTLSIKTSLVPGEILSPKLYLSCYDSACKTFRTDLRQFASDIREDVMVTLSSNKNDEGGSYPTQGSILPKYIPTYIRTYHETCNLK